MKFMKPLFLAGILTIGALGFVACSDDDEPSTGDAEAEVCSSLTELKTAVQAAGAITASSTVEEAEEARDDLTSAWDDVQSAAADLQDARIDDLEAAYNDLADTLGSIDDDATLAAAVAEIQGQVTAVDTAWDEFNTSADCV